MKKIYFLFLLFTPYVLIAQTNFKKGYVINLKGDTLKGFIDYKEWGINPKNIAFKSQVTDAKTKVFNSKDTRYFEVSGFEYYHSYVVSVSQGSNELQDLTTSPDTSTKTDTVFLKILQKGKNVSLFSYNEGRKTRFYILDNKSDVPQELIYQLYLNPEDKSSVVKRNNYYGQLSIIGNKYSVDLSDDLNGLSYDEAGLRKIAAKINGGGGNLLTTKRQGGIKFFAGISAVDHTLNYSGSKSSLPLVGSSSSSFSPGLSIGFNGYVNPDIGKIVIRTELTYSMANYSLSNKGTNTVTGGTEVSSQQLKQYVGTLGVKFIYNFYNADGLKIYAGAGIAVNLSNYPTNNYADQTTGFPAVTKTNFPQFDSTYLSIPLSAGIVINKRIDIYAGYEPQALATTYYNANGNISSYRAGINYLFGK
jgi:hypothetical protein